MAKGIPMENALRMNATAVNASPVICTDMVSLQFCLIESEPDLHLGSCQ